MHGRSNYYQAVCGGGTPYFKIFEESTTVTIPESGTYRIFAIGAGARGSCESTIYSSYAVSYGSGGCGGGGGGKGSPQQRSGGGYNIHPGAYGGAACVVIERIK